MGEANSDFGSALDSGKSALVVELRARVAELTATSTELAAKVAKLTATNAELRAQVAELEARLGAPPKTPANSSLPPSRGAKANKPVRGGRRKRKGRAGTGRKLHPHPNSVVEARAESCPHCGTDLGGAEQAPQAVYERIELPPVRPHVTRVTLHGCDCPGCGRRVTALAPQGLERGSPFGATIEALAVYLHYAQAISYERLRALFRDVFGLESSEGALANLFRRVQGRFGEQAEAIRERVRGSRVVCSDETSARVHGRKWWEWVFLGTGAVLHVLRPSRSKAEPESVLGARDAEKVEEDIKTLVEFTRFTDETPHPYRRAIYLIFGEGAEEVPGKVKAKLNGRSQDAAKIEVWTHCRVGEAASRES